MPSSRRPTRRPSGRGQRPASQQAASARPDGRAGSSRQGRGRRQLAAAPVTRLRTFASAVPKGGKAALSSTPRRSASERAEQGAPIRRAIIVAIVLAALALAGVLGVLVLSYTPAFTIERVEAQATEHLSAEEVERLAQVAPGTTLLTVDEQAVSANLRKNPWVGQVRLERAFPSTLRVSVTERRVDAICTMGSSSTAWQLGEDGVWVEPLPLTVGSGDSLYDVALAKAQEMGVLLVCDLPATVSPQAGSAFTDDVLVAVEAYREQFSHDFSSQVVAYSAPSVEGIMCSLANGVEVSLGAPSDIESKEQVACTILEQYEGRLTYINVRSYSRPSYRMLESSAVSSSGSTVEERTSAKDKGER